MRTRFFCGLLLLLLALAAMPAGARVDDPDIAGFVTEVTSAGGFSVQGWHVTVTPTTRIVEWDGKANQPLVSLPPPFLGQPMQLTGHKDKETHSVRAEEIGTFGAEPVKVKGSAVIEEVSPPGDDGVRTVRADGYRLRLSAHTHMQRDDGGKGFDGLRAGEWIGYRGAEGPDGVVDLAEGWVAPDEADPQVEAKRKKQEFVPSGPAPKDKFPADNLTGGINVTRLTRFGDEEVQSRVARVGNSMVPAWQRALPAGDPARVNFRFYAVQTRRCSGAIGLASGIVLVPGDTALRLPDDSELAAVIADGMAQTLEDQDLDWSGRRVTAVKGMELGAVTAGGGLVGLGVFEGVNLGMSAALGPSTELPPTTLQSERVSLWLMHDGGYDLVKAPVAWRRLAMKTGKTLEQTDVPPRSTALYYALGTTWRGRLAGS